MYMIIKLDKHTCSDFIAQGVHDVNIDIINAGCAGSKISVTARNEIDDRMVSEAHNDIRCWVKPEFAEKLE